MTDRYDICVHYERKPIPINTCDWVAWVDGQEEWGSGIGPTKWSAVRDLLEIIEMREDDS